MTNLLEHRKDRLLSCYQQPGIEGLGNVGCDVAVAVAREVELSPMGRIRMQQQPGNGVWRNTSHFLDGVVEGFGTSCSGRLPKVFAKAWVLELLVQILVQVSQAISVWAAGKQTFDGLQKTFLTV
jgi:hypothetical protein